MIFEDKIISFYRSLAYTRCDDTGVAYYFSAKDLPGLQCQPYSFRSSRGHMLEGCFYSYPSAARDRLVIFDHGFGGGHRSYMKEIERLCSHGYTVFAYDHTGCMLSGGENTSGMAQSLCDLNDCICALRADPRVAECDISVVGHSWGGFSAMNICSLHPEVSHIVAISGFVSVRRLVDSYFSGIFSLYRGAIMRLERSTSPDLVDADAVRSLRGSDTKALLIYSDNDTVCKKRYSYDVLLRELGDSSNVKLVLESGKGHNPNYTCEAVKYLGEYVKAKARLTRSGKLESAEDKARFVESFDWNRMTEQDSDVWKMIFEHLDN